MKHPNPTIPQRRISRWLIPLATVALGFLLNAPKAQAQFAEGFEAGVPPTGWAAFDTGSDPGVQWVSEGTPHSGSYSAYIQRSSTQDEDYLVTPQFTPTAGQYLTFWEHEEFTSDHGSTYSVRVSTTSQTGPGNFSTIWSRAENGINWAFTRQTVSLAAYVGTPIHIAFVSDNDNGDGWYVDDVSVAVPSTCLDTELPGATNMTSSGADLSWTENGSATTWDLAIGVTGFALTNIPTVNNVGSNPYTWSGGASGTAYDFYVRADCGLDNVDVSAWTGPFTFSTLCGTEAPDYTQDFSTYVPNCWEEATGPITGPTSFGSSEWTSGSFGYVGSPSAHVKISSTGGKEWLLSPQFDLSAGGYELNFDVALTQWYSANTDVIEADDAVYLMQSTDGGTTWTAIHTWNSGNSPSNTGDNTTIDISAVTSATTQFGFLMLEGATSGGYKDFYVDNFRVRTPPTCPAPSALNTTNVTSTGADLGWTENGSAMAWDIEIGATGFTPTGTPTLNDVGSNPYIWTAGIPMFTWDFYVRSDCGMDNVDVSTWTGPFSFTTPCAAIIPDYIEDFTTFLDPCWTEARGSISGPTTFGISDWMADGFGNFGVNGSARVEIYSTDGNEWLITPRFDLSAGGYELNFDVALTQFTNMNGGVIRAGDTLYLMQSIDGGANWDPIHKWHNGNNPSNTGDNTTIDISALTSATAQFAFFLQEDHTPGNDLNFYVDNFQVRTPPAPPAPPANDLCADAIFVDVNSNSVIAGTTVNGTNTGNPGTCTTDLSSGPGVWYRVEGMNGMITADLCSGTNFDTKMGIFTGTCGAFNCVADNDDFCGTQSSVTWPGLTGTTYYIYVTGHLTNNGPFNLTLSSVPSNMVVVAINTDSSPSEISWEITDGPTVIATGGPSVINGLDVQTVLLGAATPTCYGFKLMDTFGDGIINGGWELRATNGTLLLRDDFASGSVSPANPSANPNYGSAHSFCLPAGPANIAPTECGLFNNLLGNKVYAAKVIGASNYQFEFSDPDAGFMRRIARPYNYVHFWDMVSNPLIPGVKYFARVRTDRDGPMQQAHFGSGCEMGIGLPVVACTQLIKSPAYGHSCNENRTFNTSNSFIYAKPVQGATQYTFHVFNTSEGYDQTFTRNTYILQLKWYDVAPLIDGYTYAVEVSATVNGVEGPFCASECNITIVPSGNRPEASMMQANGTTSMWPNPVRDGQVNLNIDGLVDANQNITVDIQDMYGKQVFAKEFGNSGERFNTILNLNSDIASGVYLVNITVNGERTVQRLSIIR